VPHNVCVLPGYWTLEDLAAHTCDGKTRSHPHLSIHETWLLCQDRLVEWIREPARRRDRGLARWCGRVLRIRGLSAKVGAELVLALQREEPWAAVMLEEIRRDGKQPYNGQSQGGNGSASDCSRQGEPRVAL
jgi:hypothetical protein